MGERIHVTTHFLHMHAAPERAAVPCPKGAEVSLRDRMEPSAYRELYSAVGAPWLWYERSELSDSELEACLRADGVSIHVLRHHGDIAGYAEMQTTGDQTQLLYFGLLPAFIGRGLGGFFLDWTVRHAFSKNISRLWVHTCSLDHPRALDAYKRVGFQPYQRESGWVTIPEDALERQRAALGR